MSARQYILFCGESVEAGRFYSNFYKGSIARWGIVSGRDFQKAVYGCRVGLQSQSLEADAKLTLRFTRYVPIDAIPAERSGESSAQKLRVGFFRRFSTGLKRL